LSRLLGPCCVANKAIFQLDQALSADRAAFRSAPQSARDKLVQSGVELVVARQHLPLFESPIGTAKIGDESASLAILGHVP